MAAAARVGCVRVQDLLADRKPTFRAWLAVLMTVALGAAMVADRMSLTGGTWLWQLDLPKIDYPLASFFHEALAAGRLPLWNDQLGLGFPLYAEGQIGAFYPPNWLLFRLPPLDALDAVRVIHLTLAGVGAGLVALRLSGSRTGSLIASIVAVLGGAVVAKLEWTNMIEAYAWLPWVLLPLFRRPAPTRSGLVIAAVLWGIQGLSGHPNIWVLTGLAALTILVTIRPALDTIARGVGFVAVGGCVAAPQLLPTLVLSGLSVRAAGVSPNDIFASAATIFDPLSLGFADAFVTPGANAWDLRSIWYPDNVFPLFEANAYVTLTVVALASLGARTRRARPLVAVVAVMIAVPVVAAFRPGIWAEIPLLNGLRSPVRSYLVVAFALGVLAAIGIGRLGRGRRGIGLATALVVGLVAGYLVCLAAAMTLPGPFESLMAAFSIDLPGDIAAERRDLAVQALGRPFPFLLEAGLGLAAVVLMAWLVTHAGRGRRVVAGGALVVAVALPLALLSPPLNSVGRATDFSWRDTPFVRMVAAAGAHRLLTIGEPGWYEGMPDQLAAAGVPDLRMFSSLDLQASDELLATVHDDPDREPLRRIVGIDTLVTFGDPCPGAPIATLDQPRSTVCRTPALKPPYWLPADAASPLAGSTGSPIRPVEATIDPGAVMAGAREATVASWDPSGDRFTIDAPADGWVWIDRSWWPAWRTTVDSRGVTPLRGLAGQLIPVAAGRHEIAQTLVPWEALSGLALGLLAVLASGLWILRRGGPLWVSPSARRPPSPRATSPRRP